MKYLILCILGFVLCILGILISYLSLDREWFKDVQLDKLKLYVRGHEYNTSQRSELQLNDEEKEKLKIWLKSFNQGHFSPGNYVPFVVLKGETFEVNILDNRVVFSYRKGANPKAWWKQYSRPKTAEDQHIRDWLMQISQWEHPSTKG